MTPFERSVVLLFAVLVRFDFFFQQGWMEAHEEEHGLKKEEKTAISDNQNAGLKTVSIDRSTNRQVVFV